MTDLRHEWDQRITDWPTVSKIATDLGMRGEGRHFYCPGCQAAGGSSPELKIHDGGFKCFRCGMQGDIVGLVKLAQNCSLDQAIAWPEKETGERHDVNP